MPFNLATTNRSFLVPLAIVAWWGTAAAAIAQAQVIVPDAAAPLVRDRDPLLPSAFNPPRSLIFVTPDDPDFVRFLGRVRPDEVADEVADKAAIVERPRAKVQPQGVEVIDGNDADRDGYVEYYNGSAYVAELKRQPADDAAAALLPLTGVVREMHQATYQGHETPHLLLRLQHADGKHALVDAGPAAALAKLGIVRGDEVKVVARLGLINQRPALIAEQLTHEATTVKVVRMPSAG